jgi:kynurenine formamidase
VPHSAPGEAEIGKLFVAALGLRDVGRVEVSNVRVFAEPRLVLDGREPAPVRYVELNHVITEGMITDPRLPAPVFTPHLTRADSRAVYAEGTEFALDVITMIGNTGTYLDSPFHRYPDGADLAGIPLERLVDLPVVVVRTIDAGRRGVEVGDLESLGLEVAGHAVLLHTGGDRHWGTPAYAVDAPYLTRDGVEWLIDRGAALVGIDALNIDDASPGSAGERPAHTRLLAAGVPIVEHLTGLAELPVTGARFTAVPPRVTAFGTFPVRAYATVPRYEAHDHRRSAGWLPTPADE